MSNEAYAEESVESEGPFPLSCAKMKPRTAAQAWAALVHGSLRPCMRAACMSTDDHHGSCNKYLSFILLL